MPQANRPLARRRDLLWFVLGLALPLPWVLAEALHGLGIPAEVVALLAGLAILGAAFMLAWSCEVAERDIPQSLALLVLALVGVLPEYAIDLHFAWRAGVDPSYAAYATANMTGANRILIGFGWAAVVLVACHSSGAKYLVIHPRQNLELRFLIWATLYSFLIPLGGEISLFDSAVLLILFGCYVRAAMGGESPEVDLEGPAALIDREFNDLGRRVWAVVLFIFAAYAIWVSAEPFAESLVSMGRRYDIDEFLLVQWVAPLASESPEFIVAIMFAMRLRGSIGIGALVSSKVNQWTLLVGALPIAFAISSGAFVGLPLDERQTEELYLTSAQSMFAVILLSTLKVTRTHAVWLAALFVGQLFFTSGSVRMGFTVMYLVASVGVLAFSGPDRRRAFFALARGSEADLSNTGGASRTAGE
ncbi:MAG TPA: sodium:calcium antiporter [Myxococcales bacterium]|nr:sodium:calcium antiporter [Myxococcales bacterium]HIM01401.1 sodium:calcium antiporter [Myxococcales bacterium]